MGHSRELSYPKPGWEISTLQFASFTEDFRKKQGGLLKFGLFFRSTGETAKVLRFSVEWMPPTVQAVRGSNCRAPHEYFTSLQK